MRVRPASGALKTDAGLSGAALVWGTGEGSSAPLLVKGSAWSNLPVLLLGHHRQ